MDEKEDIVIYNEWRDFFHDNPETCGIAVDPFNDEKEVRNRKRVYLFDMELIHDNDILRDNLIFYPSQSINSIKRLLLKEMGGDAPKDIDIIITNFDWNKADRCRIRDIRAKDIGSTVLFAGLVRNATESTPRLDKLALKCNLCDRVFFIPQFGDEELSKIDKCPLCFDDDGFRPMRTIEHDVYTDFIKCVVEENPEGVTKRQPEKITCEIIGALTDEKYRLKPGDRVLLMGIFSVRKKSAKSLNYERYIKIIGIHKDDVDYEESSITSEDEEKFKMMSTNKHLLDDMASSLAPDIYGFDIEKKALILQQFGGNISNSNRRGNTHILMVGDPGIAKTRLRERLEEISPRCVYATGGSTSSVGITACVRQDENKEYSLEAGAAVMADGGTLIVDEFDKMDKEVVGDMHEILESQSVTISKATVHATLPTRAAVLAIMNPKGNRFNDLEPIMDQINLLPSLLSRFDLVFALRDIVNESTDRKIGNKVFDARDSNTRTPQLLSDDEMKKYIMYARSTIKNISIPSDARNLLIEEYVQLRKQSEGPNSLTITARQLEGMSRLAEASAKMRLSNVVDLHDAEVALNIFRYYLGTVCTDENGKININRAFGGDTTKDVNERLSLEALFIEEVGKIRGTFDPGYTGDIWVDIDTIRLKFKTNFEGSTDKDFDKKLAELRNNDKIVARNGGAQYKLTRQNVIFGGK